MKNLFKYMAGALFVGLAMTACSPEEFDGADQNKKPTTEGVNVTWEIDEETNQVTATVPEMQGQYPLWYIEWDNAGKTQTLYSTLNTFSRQFVEAGTYKIKLYIGNRNGFSDGAISKEITFTKTAVDWSTITKRIAGKEWRISYDEQGHLACGESGTDGTNWWAAGAQEKKGTGVYDDRITFNEDGTYTYSPGEDGLVYVNKGVTVWGTQNDAEDVDVPVQAQTSTYSFKSDFFTPKATDEDQHPAPVQANYLVLGDNTLFPYISHDDQYHKPVFRIESYSATKMVLVYDHGDIAWHYILTSQDEVKAFEGFDANSNFNMWKSANLTTTFWYAPGWAQIADPALTKDGNSYSFNLSTATSDRWQAQFAIASDIATNTATNYDFSVIVNVSKDVKAMVKLVEADYSEEDKRDNNFFFADEVQLKAGEDYIFWKSDMPGIDAHAINLVFDFGGNQDDTDVEIRNVVLKDHANDDGTVLPSDQPADGPTMDWDVTSPSNLWAAVEDGSALNQITTWFADGGWGTLPNQPSWTHADGTYEFDIPEGMGASQWQGQFTIETSLTASAAKKYNFYCVVETDQDANGVTIKLTETNYSEEQKRDNNFFVADRHDVKGGTPFVYKAEAVSLPDGDAHALSLVFDFGGSTPGTHVTISNIYFEEAVVMAYDDANNLWKAVDEGSALSQITTWFADGGWGTLPNQPVWKQSGNTYEFDIPEGIGPSQWQGQFTLETTLATKGDDPYNFSCTIETDADINGVTIKLTETNYSEEQKRDNNFYFADRHDVKGDVPFVYKATGRVLPDGDAHALSLVFDFGGAPEGTHVVIKDIIFEKAE